MQRKDKAFKIICVVDNMWIKSKTLERQRITFNYQLSIINYQLSIINYQLSIINLVILNNLHR